MKSEQQINLFISQTPLINLFGVWEKTVCCSNNHKMTDWCSSLPNRHAIEENMEIKTYLTFVHYLFNSELELRNKISI